MLNYYNAEQLLHMAQRYLEAENDFNRFHLTFDPNMDPRKYRGWCITDAEKTAIAMYTWYGFVDACGIVSANAQTVLAAAKAINRYLKKERWEVWIEFNRTMTESACRFFSI